MPKRRSACTPLACMCTYLPAQCVHCLPRARIIHPHYARGRVRARLPGWLADWLAGWPAGQPFLRFSMPVRSARSASLDSLRFGPSIDRSIALVNARSRRLREAAFSINGSFADSTDPRRCVVAARMEREWREEGVGEGEGKEQKKQRRNSSTSSLPLLGEANVARGGIFLRFLFSFFSFIFFLFLAPGKRKHG